MNIKNLFFKIGSVVCSFAFMIAIQSLDQMCGGSFYQPKVPNTLEKYRNSKQKLPFLWQFLFSIF